MRQLQAENHTLLTKALFFEAMDALWRDSGQRSLRKWLLALAGLWLAFSAYTLIRGGSFLLPLMELGVLGAVSLWALVLLPRSRARRAWQRMEEQGKTEGERVTCFYDRELEVENQGQVTALPYGEIARSLQSEKLLILIAKDKTGILLRRDGFTTGSEALVLRRIQEEQEEEKEHD